MRIAIVDDIASERQVLRARLEQQLQRRAMHAQITEYSGGETFLADAQEEPFELVFLDIYMEGISGVETAKRLRARDKNCKIIFTTSSTDHALDGFQVRALHYLVKPYSESEIDTLVEEIAGLQKVPDKYIEVKTTSGLIRLRYREILYAENYQHRIYIRTVDGKETVARQTFTELLDSLQDERFFQCSRGMIVNLEHVEDFDGTFFSMRDGKHISVNRNMVRTARTAFADFLFKRGREG